MKRFVISPCFAETKLCSVFADMVVGSIHRVIDGLRLLRHREVVVFAFVFSNKWNVLVQTSALFPSPVRAGLFPRPLARRAYCGTIVPMPPSMYGHTAYRFPAVLHTAFFWFLLPSAKATHRLGGHKANPFSSTWFFRRTKPRA